jgi:RES domain-containing protein
MIVFRLSKRRYISDLSGKGAEISGGRWNSRGTAVLYTSSSRALCTAEIAVHVPLGILPSDYMLATIEIPDDEPIEKVLPQELPSDWKSFPYVHSTKSIGDRFVSDKKYLVLKVPSAVVQGEFNYLVNPFHPGFQKVRIVNQELFEFDSRLFRE